jgi:hypothetical protein
MRRPLFLGLFYAVVGFGLYVVGKGQKVRNFYGAEGRANKDIPDSPVDMAFGLSLLFLGFLVQMVKIAASAWHGKA